MKERKWSAGEEKVGENAQSGLADPVLYVGDYVVSLRTDGES